MGNSMEHELRIAHEALSSLMFYARHYASSDPYQRHKLEVCGMLEQHATQTPTGGHFLKQLAAALRAS